MPLWRITVVFCDDIVLKDSPGPLKDKGRIIPILRKLAGWRLMRGNSSPHINISQFDFQVLRQKNVCYILCQKALSLIEVLSIDMCFKTAPATKYQKCRHTVKDIEKLYKCKEYSNSKNCASFKYNHSIISSKYPEYCPACVTAGREWVLKS